jgi:hypothetical protein
MKKILLLAIATFLLSSLIFAKEIKSTKKGGYWNNSKTWVGGRIPKFSDCVKIRGNVIAGNTVCKKLIIDENGCLIIDNGTTIVRSTLENKGFLHVNENDTLKISEFVTNHKEITNHGVIEIGF